MPMTVPRMTPYAAVQAGAAEDDAGDDGQRVLGVAADGRGGEADQRHHAGQPGQPPLIAYSFTRWRVDVDAGPAGGLVVRADDVGVPAEAGVAQDRAADQDDHDSASQTIQGRPKHLVDLDA